MVKKGELEKVIALLRQIDDLRAATDNTALTAEWGAGDSPESAITAAVETTIANWKRK